MKSKSITEWAKTRAKLKTLYYYKGITRCEMCNADNFLSFAHRHKRDFYRSDSELLGEFNQTLLLCIPCHQKIEYDKTLTEEVFARLRDAEE